VSETSSAEQERLAAFLADKPRLIRLAYRYLGSASDAEDMVQEAWLRFAKVDMVEDAPRLLATIVTRLCLDRLKSARTQREHYVGPWLPEPVLGMEGGAMEMKMGDGAALDISYAVMRVLERLSPAERAAYFLHDLWELSFEEIAETLNRTPEACRKLASRARASLAQEKQRFKPSHGDLDRFLVIFRQATASGDVSALKAMFAGDAEFISDGGGKARAALNIIHGADNVARFLVGVAQKVGAGRETRFEHATVNGSPGLVMRLDGDIDQSIVFDLDADGRFRTVYAVRNPDKLAHFRQAYETAGGSLLS